MAAALAAVLAAVFAAELATVIMVVATIEPLVSLRAVLQQAKAVSAES